jgi:hypothetical protein
MDPAVRQSPESRRASISSRKILVIILLSVLMGRAILIFIGNAVCIRCVPFLLPLDSDAFRARASPDTGPYGDETLLRIFGDTRGHVDLRPQPVMDACPQTFRERTVRLTSAEVKPQFVSYQAPFGSLLGA